jgi:hypothetical protein
MLAQIHRSVQVTDSKIETRCGGAGSRLSLSCVSILLSIKSPPDSGDICRRSSGV